MDHAARQAVESAYNGLGTMEAQGLGCPVNYSNARLFFESGAELDDPDCVFNLGTLYAGAPPTHPTARFPPSLCACTT